MLLSVEVRTKVAADNQIKHSLLDLTSKDLRRMSIIMSDYDSCIQVKDYIKHFAYLDQMVAERQF